ncbi:hypothetical protein GCM10027280_54500 [Micromonospora polyrhachis]|uniref:Uncharacterized protein n=1 Tax=Micromonospora polyrhachis TaxID=1282883 RepID=A0A7W7SVQ5_9ACTN|nr:hypothetical protein [Micromonospora polyrhachis]MBB4961828.1 hypothetical protein [Micromonospora polyrhachis]
MKQSRGTRSAGSASSAAASPDTAARRRTGLGFGVLPFIVEKPPVAPAINATWAWSLRRFARATIWLLPGYAIVFGVIALVGVDGAGPAPYASGGRPLYLVGWLGALWLGFLALMSLTSLMAAARSRRTALTALLVVLLGLMLMLPFAAMPEQTPVYGADARLLTLAGASVYTLGWLLAGWAVIRSGVFSYADGALLMLAAPMMGVVGMLVGAFQAYGALVGLAAGIGIAWRTGRLVPVGRASGVHTGPDSVAAAHVPPPNTAPAG